MHGVRASLFFASMILFLPPIGYTATHVVSGVAPDRSYQVTVDGAVAGNGVSDAAGVVGVSNIPPGTVRVSTSGNVDLIPPVEVTDLFLVDESPAGIRLTWRAPGDDGIVGAASAYELRWATSYSAMLLRPETLLLPLSPAAAGSPETFVFEDPAPGRLVVMGLRSRDEVGNWSALSNVVARVVPADPGDPSADTVAPSGITDLAIDTVEAGAFALRWTATGDDGMAGMADHYVLRWATSIPGLLLYPTTVSGVPTPSVPGTIETFRMSGLPDDRNVYVLCMVVDEAGNESPPSNVVGARTPPANTPASDAVDGLSLRGDPDFDAAGLTGEQRVWYERLLESLDISEGTVTGYASGRDLYRLARTVGNYNASLLLALRATGNLEFLDRVAVLSDLMAASLADPWLDGTEDGYLNWVYLAEPGSEHYGKDTIQLEEAMMHGNVALIAYAFHVNRDLDPGYAARADFWRAYLEDEFLAKWTARAGGRLAAWESGAGFYKRLVHPRANQLRLAHYLWKMTGDEFYRERASAIASELAQHLEPNPDYPGAVRWKHQVSGGDLGWQKVGYAHTFVRVATEIHVDLGPVFSETTLMRAFAATFRDAVYGPHDPSSGAMSERVDGSGLDGAEPYGLMVLSRWDEQDALPEVAERLYDPGSSGVWNAAAMLFAVTGGRDAPGLRPVLRDATPSNAVVAPRVSVSPNPLRDAARIRFRTPDGAPTRTRVDVFDLRGALVAHLVDEIRPGGIFDVSWRPGRSVGAGVYFVRLRAGGDAWTKRVTVLR